MTSKALASLEPTSVNRQFAVVLATQWAFAIFLALRSGSSFLDRDGHLSKIRESDGADLGGGEENSKTERREAECVFHDAHYAE